MKITVAGVEMECEKAYAWITKEGNIVLTVAPKEIAAFGVLLAAVQSMLQDASTGNVNGALGQIKPVIADVQAMAALLKLKA